MSGVVRSLLRAATLMTVLPLAPVFADTIGEEKRFEIYAVNGADFEVVKLKHMGAAEFWCAAASYTIRRQSLPSGTELYLKRGLGRSLTGQTAQTVVFSFSPQGLTPNTPSIWTIDTVGATFKSGKALRMCRDAFTRSTK